MTITTSKQYSMTTFDTAENNQFIWRRMNPDYLKYKATGRNIYQMQWLDESGRFAEPVTGEIKAQVSAFWEELEKIENKKVEYLPIDDTDPEPKHGENGYCRKCHTYCYGDCEA